MAGRSPFGGNNAVVIGQVLGIATQFQEFYVCFKSCDTWYMTIEKLCFLMGYILFILGFSKPSFMIMRMLEKGVRKFTGFSINQTLGAVNPFFRNISVQGYIVGFFGTSELTELWDYVKDSSMCIRLNNCNGPINSELVILKRDYCQLQADNNGVPIPGAFNVCEELFSGIPLIFTTSVSGAIFACSYYGAVDDDDDDDPDPGAGGPGGIPPADFGLLGLGVPPGGSGDASGGAGDGTGVPPGGSGGTVGSGEGTGGTSGGSDGTSGTSGGSDGTGGNSGGSDDTSGGSDGGPSPPASPVKKDGKAKGKKKKKDKSDNRERFINPLLPSDLPNNKTLYWKGNVFVCLICKSPFSCICLAEISIPNEPPLLPPGDQQQNRGSANDGDPRNNGTTSSAQGKPFPPGLEWALFCQVCNHPYVCKCKAPRYIRKDKKGVRTKKSQPPDDSDNDSDGDDQNGKGDQPPVEKKGKNSKDASSKGTKTSAKDKSKVTTRSQSKIQTRSQAKKSKTKTTKDKDSESKGDGTASSTKPSNKPRHKSVGKKSTQSDAEGSTKSTTSTRKTRSQSVGTQKKSTSKKGKVKSKCRSRACTRKKTRSGRRTSKKKSDEKSSDEDENPSGGCGICENCKEKATKKRKKKAKNPPKDSESDESKDNSDGESKDNSDGENKSDSDGESKSDSDGESSTNEKSSSNEGSGNEDNGSTSGDSKK